MNKKYLPYYNSLNEKVLRSILEKIDKRDVSILGDKDNV